jgi:GNAT superfamily N-acetyltransferase
MTDLVRRATADDYAVYTVLFRELGVDDPVASPERFATELAARILIYERDGHAIGYISYYKLADDGYIANLVVAPQARGARVGEALMLAAAVELRALGVAAQWQLNVKDDNAPAIRLYERMGFLPSYRIVALRMPWAGVERLPTDAAPIAVAPVCAEDDEGLERALGVLAGRLRIIRARGNRVIVQLRNADGMPVGLACFDPQFPGAFPFSVARPALAAPLLRAIAPHARPGDASLQVVVEHDDALTDALLGAGAEVRMRLVHYIGPLPHVAAR